MSERVDDLERRISNERRQIDQDSWRNWSTGSPRAA